MRLAVVLPYQNRELYKEFQKQYLTNYLSDKNINHRIFFCEQNNNNVFNRSKTINFGVKFAIEYYRPDYLVISDIDTVPINVDYVYKDLAEVWFMTAGGVKISTKDFIKVNGFNNKFEGWGYEDSEFWHRLNVFNIKNEEWHKSVKKAELIDLELFEEDSLKYSKSYFGLDVPPRVYKSAEHSLTKDICVQYPKTWLTKQYRDKNSELYDFIKSMSKSKSIDYFIKNGLNELKIEDVILESRTDTISELHWK